MRRPGKAQQGFALILTILIVSLIVSVSLQFNTDMRSNVLSAANLRDGIRLSGIARSGFDYALAVLFEDLKSNDFDSVQEAWFDADLLSSNSGALFETGNLETVIIDHSGKIQVNRLVNEQGGFDVGQQDLLKRFLSLETFELDSEQVDNIVDALKDWIDTDNEVTRFGAEESYYKALEKPYRCKNGPMESLEELLLIRGVTRELYYGTEEKPGISQYLTIYGEGLININTAPRPVLMALSEQLDQELADEMMVYRKDEDHDLKNPGWYKKISGMGDVTLPQNLITTASTHFEIRSAGILDAMVQTISGFVERQADGRFVILSWKID